MQLSCVLVMTAWGAVLRNPWVAGAGLMSFLYGWGLASWDEGEDMRTRFGETWERYRGNVPSWRVRLRPWHDPNSPAARLYIAETCTACAEVRKWFESHEIAALEVVPAECHPTRELRRITYDPMDGSQVEEGVNAFARGLEHLDFGWAFVGAVLRLPGVSHFVQLLMDAGGLGPRVITADVTVCKSTTRVRKSTPAGDERGAG